MFRAAADGESDLVADLLAEGADVNARSDRGQTALMLAAVFGSEEIVSLLLNAGADATLKDALGLTAREWSVRRGFTRIAELITEASPDEELAHSMPDQAPLYSSSQAPYEIDADHYSENQSGVRQGLDETPTNRNFGPNEREADVDSGKRELGGAAAAILRTRAAQASREAEQFSQQSGLANAAADFDLAGKPEEEDATLVSSLRRITTEIAPTPVFSRLQSAPLEETPVFEISGKTHDDDVPSPSQTGDFELDAAQQWSIPPSEPDPLTLPPEVLSLSQASSEPKNAGTTPDLLTLPPDTEDTVITTATTSRRPELKINDDETPPGMVKVPSFGSLPTANSRHPLLWILVAVVLGGSAFLAYRLNTYVSRSQSVTPATSSQVEQKNVPVSGPDVSGSVATNRAPVAENTSVGNGLSAATVGDDSPVTGGPLAGTERNLPKPDYPSNLRSKGVAGTISILVRVNRQGRVISWRTLEGENQFRAAALKAAKKATFNPDKLPGKGEVVGTITYKFQPKQ